MPRNTAWVMGFFRQISNFPLGYGKDGLAFDLYLLGCPVDLVQEGVIRPELKPYIDKDLIHV